MGFSSPACSPCGARSSLRSPAFAGVSAPRALIPLALASALWYGLLTALVATLGTNLDAVLAVLARVNWVLGAAALGSLIFLAV